MQNEYPWSYLPTVHALDRVTRDETHTRMSQTREQIIAILRAKIATDPTDTDSIMQVGKLRNEAVEAERKLDFKPEDFIV